MDFIEPTVKLVAIIGGLIAAFRAIAEYKENRIHKDRELRWNQAKYAKAFYDEIYKVKKVQDALLMIDWSGRNYNITADDITSVTHNELWCALRINNEKFNDKEVYIRDCFDELFTNIALIEHSIQIGLFTYEDVSFFFKYYVKKVNIYKKKDVFENYFSKYDYEQTKAFFDRYKEWRA